MLTTSDPILQFLNPHISKSKICFKKIVKKGGGGGGGGGSGGMAQNHFSVLIPFFKIQFKNTSNLSLLGFKMSSESFLFEDFKTFWHM